MMEANLTQIKQLIDKAASLALVAHFNPDGDAVGAVLGLTLFLRRLGKEVHPLFPSAPSSRYAFLTGFSLLRVEKEIPPVDLILVLDCAAKERFSSLQLPPDYQGELVNIDHHEGNTNFGTLNLVLPQASSSGEIIFDLCGTFNQPLNAAEAAALYVSLLTDTGDFHFLNTTPKAMQTAAALIEAGASPKELSHQLYEATPFNWVRLLGLVLATLEQNRSGEIAWVRVTQEMFTATGTTAAAVEDVINQLTKIKGLKIALLFREDSPTLTKVSLRSIEGIKANGIAARFGGGGHAVAAGCHLEKTLRESIPDVLAVCEEAVAAFGRDN